MAVGASEARWRGSCCCRSDGPVVVIVAVALEPVAEDGGGECLSLRDDVIGALCCCRLADRLAPVFVRMELGLCGDERDDCEVDGCFERTEDRQLGSEHELGRGGQAAA